MSKNNQKTKNMNTNIYLNNKVIKNDGNQNVLDYLNKYVKKNEDVEEEL